MRHHAAGRHHTAAFAAVRSSAPPLAAARTNGDPARVADQLVEAAVEAKVALESIGNEAGRNLAMFNTWARLSQDGLLARFERRLPAEHAQNPAVLATIPADLRPKLQ
jgi:hypothetical protein